MTLDLDFGDAAPNPRKRMAQTWSLLEGLDAESWQTIEGQIFVEGEIYLDGRKWVACHFGRNCRIVTALGLFRFEACTFDPGVNLVLDPPASAAVDLVGRFERGEFGRSPLTH